MGSAEVTDSSGPALREIARQIQESIKKEPGTKIRIIGYTDSLGDSSFNVKLSYQRALAIRNILLKETGIDSSIIEPVGMGSSSPIASNSTPQGRDLNRRVLVEMAHTSINESVGKPYFF